MSQVTIEEDAFGRYGYDPNGPRWPSWITVVALIACMVAAYWR